MEQASSKFRLPIRLECPAIDGPISLIPDTPQLSKVIMDVFGVPARSIEEFSFGVFNRLFLIQLDASSSEGTVATPQKVLVRIAKPLKAKSDIDLESEVASMVYVRANTSIPVPVVYAYCPTRKSAVGGPFMIISFMEGVPIASDEWDNASLDVQLRTVRDYAGIVSELSRLKFNKVGSLYFSPRDLSLPQKSVEETAFEVGPIAWCKACTDIRRTLPVHDRGPWAFAAEWLSASLVDELQFMADAPAAAQTQGDEMLVVHIDTLWPQALQVLPALLKQVPRVTSDNWSASQFVLAHMDLSIENILIEPSGPNAGRICAVIDWEMAATVPLWQLICLPAWFEKQVPWLAREEVAAKAFKTAYLDELGRLGNSDEVIQMAEEYVWKRRFVEIVTISWCAADMGGKWLQEHLGKE